MKTNNPKIDIYVNGNYRASTTWAKTCTQAVERFKNAYPDEEGKVTARFAKD
jgi:hypothetical protein